MPIYEYQCKTCHEVCEVLQKAKDKPPEKCPKCGGPMVKRISSPAIQFKGSGWYVTDYAKKSSTPAGAKAPAKGESKDEAKAEPKAEAKNEAKAGSGAGAEAKPGKSSS
ncbi:MAG: zinc ribbon domain-containing protein [Candidatus Aminicenantes bacterium]|nr:MAG: zinc ribbon domain-containing protein [Candidatus Aminicenantes bacterium]